MPIPVIDVMSRIFYGISISPFMKLREASLIAHEADESLWTFRKLKIHWANASPFGIWTDFRNDRQVAPLD